MTKPPPPKRAWLIAWLALFGGTFLVLEGAAIADPAPGDTLTESLRWLVFSMPVGGVLGFLAFIGWFTWHILFQRSRKDEDGHD